MLSSGLTGLSAPVASLLPPAGRSAGLPRGTGHDLEHGAGRALAWPLRPSHILQARQRGRDTPGHGAGADRGRRAHRELVRRAAEEGDGPTFAPRCVGQGWGLR